jgi:hypothetical protein
LPTRVVGLNPIRRYGFVRTLRPAKVVEAFGDNRMTFAAGVVTVPLAAGIWALQSAEQRGWSNHSTVWASTPSTRQAAYAVQVLMISAARCVYVRPRRNVFPKVDQ